MHKVLGFITFLMLCISCDSPTVYSTTQAMPGFWDKNDTVVFTLPQLDSLKPYNLFLNIRNDNSYPYSNIFLVVTMEFPHGRHITDTLEYRMAYPDGTWMGSGIGNVKENKLWYKEGVRFMEKGNYNIIITQAIRNNGSVEGVKQLQGITDIGISIEGLKAEAQE